MKTLQYSARRMSRGTLGIIVIRNLIIIVSIFILSCNPKTFNVSGNQDVAVLCRLEDGSPCSKFRIELLQNDEVILKTRLSKEGQFVLHIIDGESYQLVISRRGFVRQEIDFDYTNVAPTGMTIKMEKVVSIH